jgi:hypothetical protein
VNKKVDKQGMPSFVAPGKLPAQPKNPAWMPASGAVLSRLV